MTIAGRTFTILAFLPAACGQMVKPRDCSRQCLIEIARSELAAKGWNDHRDFDRTRIMQKRGIYVIVVPPSDEVLSGNRYVYVRQRDLNVLKSTSGQ